MYAIRVQVSHDDPKKTNWSCKEIALVTLNFTVVKWPYKRSIIALSMRFFLVFVSLESFLKQHNGSFHAVFVNDGRSGGLDFIIYLWYIIYTHVYYTHDQAILYSQNCRSSSSSSASRSQMNRLSRNKELRLCFWCFTSKTRRGK